MSIPEEFADLRQTASLRSGNLSQSLSKVQPGFEGQAARFYSCLLNMDSKTPYLD